MSPPRAHDSRPISLGSPDAVALLLDRIDDIADAVGKIDGAVRTLERTCERIEAQHEAARSRASRETKRQDDEDKSIEERVRELEKALAESKGTNKIMALLALVAAGGTGAGITEAVKVIT